MRIDHAGLAFTSARVVAFALALAALAACTPTTESPMPSPSPVSTAAPVALFLGDSYTVGTGLPSTVMGERWSTVLATRQGWEEINAGCNGSGYTRVGLSCGNTYLGRIPLLANREPDLVVVSGGVNDLGASAAHIREAVAETFAELRATFPDAEIVAVGGIFYTGTDRPPLLQELNDAVEAAATQQGATFIDIGEPLLGHPELMAPDGLHPNSEGHALIADLTEQALGY